MQKMNKNGFSRCAEMYIERLRKEGRYSTAHVYKNALLSFTTFCGTFNVSFRQVTRGRLRCYGQYLYECGLKPNTVSTYMRMLRCIYNRGVESGVPLMCTDYFTMSIQGWISGKRKPCRLPSFTGFCMMIPNRSACVIHKLLLL